ncbi:CDP-alcohol phosphatidyltransferase family protein [Deinococcus psychrotolerans]|uniref:CDP-alcohol phosphatidyltransferase family protein n=1 Tax=Deinococcus psychrotolerans TaxID=2489213 RepID=A0A3G8YBI9_9DEIO|nr:CDP-alcohol phosphatidyltransferase family protein [Deinococcus psychrotolerans]AZI42732.1 CDP-alcohol phosphatidyltransferase family protein [Deinococcus psychrotolerans]
MTVYAAKPAFQKLLRPLAYRLADLGVSANAVTLSAMFLSVALGARLAITIVGGGRWVFFLLPAFLLTRMALNAIDGLIARERHQVSRLGAYLNELGDVVSDSALYLPFALLPYGWPAAMLVALSAASELAGVLGQVSGGTRRYDGPLGKSDRALWLSLLALLLGFGVAPGVWLAVVLAVLCVLAALTIVNRVQRGLGEVS